MQKVCQEAVRLTKPISPSWSVGPALEFGVGFGQRDRRSAGKVGQRSPLAPVPLSFNQKEVRYSPGVFRLLDTQGHVNSIHYPAGGPPVLPPQWREDRGPLWFLGGTPYGGEAHWLAPYPGHRAPAANAGGRVRSKQPVTGLPGNRGRRL